MLGAGFHLDLGLAIEGFNRGFKTKGSISNWNFQYCSQIIAVSTKYGVRRN